MDRCVIQTGPVDQGYNCHGWVFTGGRFWVRGTAVPDILRDNGYRPVARPRTGDLAVFTDHGSQVTHSALVRGRGTKGAVLLESKWGSLARYVHTARKHAYASDKLTYYRTDRGSHLLSALPVHGVAAVVAPRRGLLSETEKHWPRILALLPSAGHPLVRPGVASALGHPAEDGGLTE
jgi:hypothetical protein